MFVMGADKVMRKLSKLERRVKEKVDEANRRSGEELVRTAKVLIPMGGDVEKDGHERGKITGSHNPDGSYLVDFGPKSKVIEGDRGPRPFVNPALKVLRKKHGARVKRAVNKAVKESFSG